MLAILCTYYSLDAEYLPEACWRCEPQSDAAGRRYDLISP